MTTLIFAQPSVMTSLVANATFHGRGLCARFLYSIPVSTVGSRKFESKPIDEVTAERYYKLVESLLKIQHDGAKIIKLSNGAYKALKEFSEKIEPMLVDELADIADFAGKFVGAVLRIAGLIYLADNHEINDSELLLPENFMQSAIIIGEYFLEHAKVAYQLMGADEVTEQCKYILRQLQKNRPSTIQIRDVMRLCQKFKTAEAVQAPILRLCDYAYLRELQVEYSGNGRPPAKQWEVNPAIYNMEF